MLHSTYPCCIPTFPNVRILIQTILKIFVLIYIYILIFSKKLDNYYWDAFVSFGTGLIKMR
jgi:hypothetical protein